MRMHVPVCVSQENEARARATASRHDSRKEVKMKRALDTTQDTRPLPPTQAKTYILHLRVLGPKRPSGRRDGSLGMGGKRTYRTCCQCAEKYETELTLKPDLVKQRANS